MISRQLGRFLLLVALVAVAAPTVSSAAEGQQTSFVPIPGTVVSAPGVNIRDCPRVDCEVRAVALLGEQILITGEGVEGFVPVAWGGLTGFAYGLYIATPGRRRAGTATGSARLQPGGIHLQCRRRVRNPDGRPRRAQG